MPFDGVPNESAIFDFFSFLAHMTVEPEVKLLLSFFNDRAID